MYQIIKYCELPAPEIKKIRSKMRFIKLIFRPESWTYRRKLGSTPTRIKAWIEWNKAKQDWNKICSSDVKRLYGSKENKIPNFGDSNVKCLFYHFIMIEIFDLSRAWSLTFHIQIEQVINRKKKNLRCLSWVLKRNRSQRQIYPFQSVCNKAFDPSVGLII